MAIGCRAAVGFEPQLGAGLAANTQQGRRRLSATGQISLYNDVGSVAVLADVVGYYADHNHDDRYYTKEQINGLPSSSIIAGPAYSATEPSRFHSRGSVRTGR